MKSGFKEETDVDGNAYGYFALGWSKKSANILKEKKYKRVSFSGTFKKFEFLKDVEDSIEDGSFSNEDRFYDGVLNLRNLRKLGINGGVKGKLDFLELPKLEQLGITWKKNGFPNLLALPKLETLSVRGFGEASFMGSPTNLVLRSFTSYKPKIEKLEGISAFENLEYLSLSDATKLIDVNEISSLKKLKHLNVEYAPNILSWKVLSESKKLEHLFLSKAGHITDVSFVYGLNNLRKLVIIGEGVKVDWSCIMKLPLLKETHINVDSDSWVSKEILLNLATKFGRIVDKVDVHEKLITIKFKV